MIRIKKINKRKIKEKNYENIYTYYNISSLDLK